MTKKENQHVPQNLGKFPDANPNYYAVMAEAYKAGVSARVLSLRLDLGLTQRELAEYMAITSKAITMIETGKRLPSFELLCKLADFFDVSLDYLVGRSNARKVR